MKKTYSKPKVDIQVLRLGESLLSLSGSSEGIGNGGKASEAEGGLPEPESRVELDWDN